ncbi:MAG: phosphate ABC transporter substrate-binding protein PstS [Alphaproteobacteria bacterium]
MAFFRKRLLAAAVAVVAMSAAASAADISGAGATFPYPIYAKWADAYKQKTGNAMNYQSIGSGGGIKQITSKTVDFGATDMPLKGEQLQKEGLAQWPMVMGGVVPVVNLPGLKPGELKLTGDVLAGIYLGKIQKWNAPEIKQLNPNANLPDLAILPVRRSDGSGTNFLFTTYLSQISPEFEEKVGAATAVEFPTGVGAKGNEGVAAMTGRTRGAIGYVEYAYALQHNMTYAQLKNRDGKFVSPDIKAFQAAASGADWSSEPGFGVVLTNQPGDASWPITGATFVLMHKRQNQPQKAKEVLDFFDWAYHNGDRMAEELHYVPMPSNVTGEVETMWKKEIVGPDGKPVWTGPAS